MPVVPSLFHPAWFAPGPHAQTLWAALFRRTVRIRVQRERLDLPDGDFVDLDWCGCVGDRPLVVLLHGLQGSIRSAYIRGMMQSLTAWGFGAVLMHFRGCGGEPNRLPRGYHSGDTADLAFLIDQLRGRYPRAPLAAIGYSLGANVLLKWLGETGPTNPLAAAVAVSPPFELGPCADHISRGFSRIYESHLLGSLQRAVRRKAAHVQVDLPMRLDQLRRLRTLRHFDQHITAPLHGFDGAEDYYTRSSCRQYLKTIAVPTLIVHARDDPFMPPQIIPAAQYLSPSVQLELSERGGHVGFITGAWPWAAQYWLEQRVPQFLQSVLGGCAVTTRNPSTEALPQ